MRVPDAVVVTLASVPADGPVRSGIVLLADVELDTLGKVAAEVPSIVSAADACDVTAARVFVDVPLRSGIVRVAVAELPTGCSAPALVPLRSGIVRDADAVVETLERFELDVPVRAGIVLAPELIDVVTTRVAELVPVLSGIVLEPAVTDVTFASKPVDVPVRSGIVLEPVPVPVSADKVLADVPVTSVMSGANRIPLENSIQGAASAVPVSSSVASDAFSPKRKPRVNEVAEVLTARPPTSTTKRSPACADTCVKLAEVEPTGNRALRAEVAVAVLTHSLMLVVVLSWGNKVPRTVDPSDETTLTTIWDRAFAPVALSRARMTPLTVPLISCAWSDDEMN